MRKALCIFLLLAIVLSITACGGDSVSSASQTVKMIDVVGKQIDDAISCLNDCGLTNITSNVPANDELSKWLVVSQNIDVGTKISLEESIVLQCLRKYKVAFEFESDFNLLFNKYDIKITIDGTEFCNLANGGTYSNTVELLSGSHELVFCKNGSTSPKSNQSISVNNDMSFKCKLDHDGSSISLRDIEIVDIPNEIESENEESSESESIEENLIEMIDVSGMILSDAKSALKDAGFSNITINSSIFNDENWTVENQSIAEGTNISHDAEIILECNSIEESLKDVFIEKNLSEAKGLFGEENRYYVIRDGYEEQELSTFLEGIDDADVERWSISELSWEDGESPLVVMYIECAEIEGLSSIEEPIQEDPTGQAEGDSNLVPVMTGRKLSDVIEAAKKYGVSENQGDMDFGHGTRLLSLSDKDFNLSLDIIYFNETKEILCGSFISLNGTANIGKQKEFILGMASVLCPVEDANEVSKWVEQNIGKDKEITINGFVYELWHGPVGNLLYSAGERNWEEWELSF